MIGHITYSGSHILILIVDCQKINWPNETPI